MLIRVVRFFSPRLAQRLELSRKERETRPAAYTNARDVCATDRPRQADSVGAGSMRGSKGERLGDPLEGEDPRERPVALVVVDSDGVKRPGFMLRAGDYIRSTHYEHDRRLMTAEVVAKPVTLRVRLRRWWEGRRR